MVNTTGTEKTWSVSGYLFKRYEFGEVGYTIYTVCLVFTISTNNSIIVMSDIRMRFSEFQFRFYLYFSCSEIGEIIFLAKAT